MNIISSLIDLLFPKRCVFCRKFLKRDERDICTCCTHDLPFTQANSAYRYGEFFDVCAAALFYTGHVRNSILRYKFKGAEQYAECYGKILADCIRTYLAGRYDVITWVPLSDGRKIRRGYDQAMLLAFAAALELDDVAVEVLKKTRERRAQSMMNSAEERRANVLGAYIVADKELIEGKRVLVIDDIITTGATLSECARVLLTAGAAEVVCATLARTE
jgi:competence protein ComFC